ncbi:MAG: imidazole glycerol phosphate synthase subunit HisH [Solirubrobacterales bacterium]|nr:imidazole glycerol phosphate synthase subunit HisH [Solirubrobacterales bacterium]MBV9797388.1 imidazole glycerol phosphate synthase subunit HisH [Solirubrobacterales bacterium]
MAPDESHRGDRPNHQRDRHPRQPHSRRRRPWHERNGRWFPRSHARSNGPTRAPRPERPGTGRSRDRCPSHGRGRRHLHRPGARPGARRPGGDRPLRTGHSADGRVARLVRDRYLGPGAAGVRGLASSRRDRQLRPRAGRGVLPRAGRQRQGDRAHLRGDGDERPPRDRGRVQGVRPRIAAGGRGRSIRARGPEHQGNAGVIGLVDYGMGNRRSVQKALEHVGARVTVSHDSTDLDRCAGLVVPGVGAFPLAMRNLRELGLVDLIRARAAAGTPLLGICLGMQLLFDASEELEPTEGLGLIGGEVTRLRAGDLRLPHIGWNDVSLERSSPLTTGLPRGGCPFYHVHSFAARPRDPQDVIGTTEYGERFATIVRRDRVFGVQFHPEKSSAHGLAMLAAFVGLCARSTGAAVAA